MNTPAIRSRPPPVRKSNSTILLPIMLVAAAVLVGQMFWLKKNDYMFRPFSLERIVCDECRGMGVVRDRKDDEILRLCESCFGVGSRMLRRIDAEDNLCPACLGIGRLEDEDTGDWRACRRCDGRGLIRDAPWASSVGAFTNAAVR